MNRNDNLPPGVTDKDIEDQADGAPCCEVCGRMLFANEVGECHDCEDGDDIDDLDEE
jgi:hypothetical protein